MKEEGKNPNSQNTGFKKLVRKKWFYPAVYLTFAALILTAVIWYQNKAIDLPEDTLTGPDIENPTTNDDNESVPVVGQEEMLKMPVTSATDAEIVTKFFDYNASMEEKEQALILYNNKYYQSVGVDIASADDQPFDVTAALSGTVTDVVEHPLMGMVVEITHDNGITTKYASLGEVTVSKGEDIIQGDVIGTAGKNLYGQANGTHVHFELRKDDVALNPEDFFNKSVSEIKQPQDDEDGKEEDDAKEEENADQEEANAESEHDELSTDDAGDDENQDDEEDNTDNSGQTESSASSASV